ncbi:hypothetical protein ACFXGI_38520 [Streptomyces sp. NPDC059355]|uniref:hypothetical protein n=1 Tax=Streptomyces sp. NPDC059355 TaxID=3346811 RepID=UPI003675620A
MFDFSQSSPADLLQAMQHGAGGLWEVEAAVWLLERHGVWLHDLQLRPYIDGGVGDDGVVWAGLDPKRVGAAIESGELGEWGGEDLTVLRFILSLWGDYPIGLRFLCVNLSEEAVELMGKALLLANGYDLR